ncbi:MAG: nuclear transport factor 2 family protein, partial [Myxococcota bacterium]
MSDATADALREITEVRAIEILKAKYFRLLDTKQWDAWRALFTDDFDGTY